MKPTEIPTPSSELAQLELGDSRLNRRGVAIAEMLAVDPSASFPNAMGDEAALEGFYRFINNDKVTLDALLEPHHDETCARAEAVQSTLVLHDTTEVHYAGERREGLGRLSTHHQGYFAHMALAVTADASHKPLGVLGVETYSRSWDSPKKRTNASRKLLQSNKESGRWRKLVDAVETERQGRFLAIHVMDREADSYEFLAHLCQNAIAFVVRVQFNRLLATEGGKREQLEARVSRGIPVVGRSAKLSRRAKGDRAPERLASRPPRDERIAHLLVRASVVEVPRAHTCADPDVPKSVKLHCVCVDEPDPPPNVEPVRWRLWTQLPIATAEQLLGIVDIYRARWIIEEFFKALKTGCALEKRQQETEGSLLNVLGLLVPIAWRLLLLRSLARHAPDASATEALTVSQVDVLRAFTRQRLSTTPTVRECLLAIAGLGGHLRNNGDPGWLVLGRGFEKLLTMDAAWRAARGEM